jgi:cephalosporin-C deacetylase-like acetyl esterase
MASTLKGYNLGKIKVEEIYYLSRPYKGKPTRIFGYFCYPGNFKRPLPAILIVHGGGGGASRYRAVNWAKQGYATLAIDLPGKGERRSSSRSTGPDMEVPNLINVSADNYLIHAVAAARNALTYLIQRKEVDPRRLGMIGLSWGGVITLLTNGQDDRLKAAVNVFGAGYIPEGCTWEDYFRSFSKQQIDLWYSFLDPKNFLSTQKAPILFVTGTNDHCYYLPTFQKSYEEVASRKSLWVIPNLKHRFLPFMEMSCLAWFEKYLKNRGGFEGLTLLPVYLSKNHEIIVPVKANSIEELVNAKLYFSPGGPQQWTRKSWSGLAPSYKDYYQGIFYFALSPQLISPEILFFVGGQDIFKGNFSSLVQSIFKVELKDGAITYAVSAPVKDYYRHTAPITLLNGMDGQRFYFILSEKDRAYRTLDKI